MNGLFFTYVSIAAGLMLGLFCGYVARTLEVWRVSASFFGMTFVLVVISGAASASTPALALPAARELVHVMPYVIWLMVAMGIAMPFGAILAISRRGWRSTPISSSNQ